MPVRARVATLTVAVIALAPIVVLSSASAQPPEGFTAPAGIPDTTGLANPVSATAPNGADLLLWGVPAGGTTNTYRARLRLPGRTAWAKVPAPFKRQNFAGVNDVASTKQGDFWITWVAYENDLPSTYLQKLDTKTKTWTKPRRVFHKDGYGFGGAVVAVAGNGTVLVGAYAQAAAFTSPPKYRTIVATKFPGRKWKEEFLTIRNGFSTGVTVDANGRGQLVASWIEGYNLGSKTVHAATHVPSPKADWAQATLSEVGDSQSARSTIGRDGTAAVIWTAPDQNASAVRLSTKEVGTPLSPWIGHDVVTGTQYTGSAQAVVNKNGDVTALWLRSNGSDQVVWSRQLVDDVLQPPVQVSPDLGLAFVAGAELGTDGQVRVLFHQYSAGPSNEGMRLAILSGGSLEDTLVLTEAGDGNANGEALGLDAAARPNVVWTRGDYPDTDFTWMGVDDGSGGPLPALMSSPASGKSVEAVKAKGTAKVGRTLTCKTGYWVEASESSISWYRDGHFIRGSSARKYRLAAADRGKDVRCDAFGAGHDEVVRVKGTPRTVR